MGKAAEQDEAWHQHQLGDANYKSKVTRDALIHRDGNRCFFCKRPGDDYKMTIEHLLARVWGGTDQLANLCLACVPCNNSLGDAPVVLKMRVYAGEIALDDAKRYAGAMNQWP